MLHVFSKKKWNVKLKSYFLSKIDTMRHWNWLGQCSRYIFIYVTQVSYTIWTWLWSVCEPRRSACNTLTMSYRPMWDKAFSSTPRDVFRLLLAQVCSIVWQQWTLSPYVSNCFIFSGVYPSCLASALQSPEFPRWLANWCSTHFLFDIGRSLYFVSSLYILHCTVKSTHTPLSVPEAREYSTWSCGSWTLWRFFSLILEYCLKNT